MMMLSPPVVSLPLKLLLFVMVDGWALVCGGGFALFGGHRGGEAIDPDERLALVQLGDAAGPAYKHIRMEQLNRESAEWHIERTVFESDALCFVRRSIRFAPSAEERRNSLCERSSEV